MHRKKRKNEQNSSETIEEYYCSYCNEKYEEPLLTPHFYFPHELYVYITLTNNYIMDNFNKLTQMAVSK